MFEFLKSFSNPFKPKAGVNVGGYEAAAVTRDRSYIFPYQRETQDNANTHARTEIIRITRYLVNNYALAERILSCAETYAIGGGLVANPGTSDQEFNEAYAKIFESWANSVFCFQNNQYSFYEAQKLMVRELLIAGEFFIVLVKADSGYPQLQLVPSEDVRSSGKPEDKSVDGLFLDAFGRVIAYNVWSGSSSQTIDAGNVIHVMRHKQIGQLRGVGAFAASLNSMRDIKDLLTLEKKAVKVHSTLAAVVKRNTGDVRGGGIGELLPGETPTPPAGPANNIGVERAFPGAVIYAEPGEDVDLLSSDRSTQGFLSHIETLMREVCLNISLPYEFAINADKLTGVGIRFVLSDAAFFFGNLQNVIVDGAFNRIYAYVTGSFIKSGIVSAPKNDLPWAVTFTRPISITVDTQRVTNADISLLQNGLLTYESYYSARGKDWKAEIRQRAQEEAFLDQVSAETGISVNRLRTASAGAEPAAAAETPAEPDQSEQQKAA